MSTVKVKLCPDHLRRDVFISTDLMQYVKSNLDLFTITEDFEVQGTGMDAAEEAFDLTNNPSRDCERQDVYGYLRSVSVGDVVQVTDNGITEDYLCQPMGWKLMD